MNKQQLAQLKKKKRKCLFRLMKFIRKNSYESFIVCDDLFMPMETADEIQIKGRRFIENLAKN